MRAIRTRAPGRAAPRATTRGLLRVRAHSVLGRRLVPHAADRRRRAATAPPRNCAGARDAFPSATRHRRRSSLCVHRSQPFDHPLCCPPRRSELRGRPIPQVGCANQHTLPGAADASAVAASGHGRQSRLGRDGTAPDNARTERYPVPSLHAAQPRGPPNGRPSDAPKHQRGTRAQWK